MGVIQKNDDTDCEVTDKIRVTGGLVQVDDCEVTGDLVVNGNFEASGATGANTDGLGTLKVN